MEDGYATELVQQAIVREKDERLMIELGGTGTEDQENLITVVGRPRESCRRDGVGATGRSPLLFAVHKAGPEPVQDCGQHRH